MLHKKNRTCPMKGSLVTLRLGAAKKGDIQDGALPNRSRKHVSKDQCTQAEIPINKSNFGKTQDLWHITGATSLRTLWFVCVRAHMCLCVHMNRHLTIEARG